MLRLNDHLELLGDNPPPDRWFGEEYEKEYGRGDKVFLLCGVASVIFSVVASILICVFAY